MAENRMAEIAKMYGLELGERFSVKNVFKHDRYHKEYSFETNGVAAYNENGVEVNNSFNVLLIDLALGRCEIVKKPWKPNAEERYFFVDSEGNGSTIIEYNDFDGCMFDYMCYAIGNCFRTKEEAEAHKDEVIARLKEIYEKGRENEGDYVSGEDI